MPGFRGWSSACVRAAALSFALLSGFAGPSSAGQTPAGVAAKLGTGGASLAKLWDGSSQRLPVIVEFAASGTASTTVLAGKSDDDAALAASIDSAQDAILLRLFGANLPNAERQGSAQNIRRMAYSPLFALSASAAEVEQLAVDPQVVRIHADTLSYPQLVQTVPLTGMPAAYASGATGDGKIIAILDSGVRRSHEFLAGKVTAAACFSNADASAGIVSTCPGGAASSQDLSSADDCDPADAFGCGHGTHVAGIAAGFNTNAQAGEPQNGVARAAKLFPINVMSRALPGSAACKAGCLVSFASSQILGLEAVYARREKLAVAAVALGLAERTAATDCALDPRGGIIARLRAAGIATVVPAGNDGADAVVPAPGCIALAITVAASTKKDERAFFSNWGPQVDLVAPGVEVLSSAVAGDGDSGYAALTGTSMAVPHVAGAIAALRTVRPEASVSQIEDALEAGGVPVVSAGISRPRIRLDRALGDLAKPQVRPDNDFFHQATVIFPPSGSVQGTNAEATFEDGEPNHGSFAADIRSVWWEYTPTATGTLTIDVSGAAFDAALAVYTGTSVEELTEISAFAPGQFNVTAGTTYHIAVAGRAGTDFGTFQLDYYQQRPANDDFANAIEISPPSGTSEGTNVGATAQAGEPPHGSTSDRTVWWKYTPTTTGNVIIDTRGSSFDTVMSVYTGSAVNALTHIVSNDDFAGSTRARVAFAATAGVTYRIAVAGVDATDVGAIRVSLGSPPANDNFENRIALGDLPSGGDNTVATAQGGEPSHGGGAPTRSLWWSFTAPSTGNFSVRIEPSGGLRTVAAAYTGTAINSLTLVASATPGGLGVTEMVFAATEGVAYAIAVDSDVAHTGGAFTIRAEAIRPVNDNFASRIAIAGPGTVNGSSLNATAESGEYTHLGTSDPVRSVWWSFTSATTSRYTLETVGSDFNTVLAVYTGTAVNTLEPVEFNDDIDGGNNRSRVTWNAVAGTSYAIVVAGSSGATGAVTLNLVGLPPDNDNFENSIVLGAPVDATAVTANGTNTFATLEAFEFDHGGVSAPVRSVWWNFTPTITSNYTLETVGSDFNTTLTVYAGTTIEDIAPVVFNDDIGGGNNRSRLTLNGVAGTTYHVVVAGSAGATGNITLTARGVPPANDNFASRITVAPAGETVTGSNNFATGETGEPNHASASTPVRSVWWSFTPSATRRVFVDTSGSALNTTVAVYTGTAPNLLTLVASNDDIGGGNVQSLAEFTATAGTQYQIAVSGKAGAMGAISTQVGLRPANDNFADRIDTPTTIPVGGATVLGNSTFATAETGEPNHASASTPARSIWWRFRPSVTGRVTLETVGSNFDTVLAVYTGGAVNTATQVASNDDIGGGNTRSRVTFDAVGGTNYAIVVAGKAGATGAVTLKLNGIAPANDNFANRIAIAAAPGTVTGTTGYATFQTGEPDHLPGFAPSSSVWWSFVAPVSGVLTLDTAGSASRPALAVYTGSAVNALTLVGRDDGNSPGSVARVAVPVVRGTSYAIVLAGYEGSGHAVRLNLAITQPNDNFANAAAISGFGAVTGQVAFATAETGEPTHAGNATARNSIWYYFYTPTGTAYVTLDLSGSNFDTVLAVYTGSAVNALTPVASNDNIDGSNLRSRVTFLAQANVRYAIAIAGNNNSFDSAGVGVDLRPAPPLNDNFANRITIAAPGTVTGFNIHATEEGGEPNHAGVSTPISSVWWSFTPTTTGQYTLDTTGSDFNTTLAVYTGAGVGVLSTVAANDDIGGGNVRSRVTFQAIAGTQYQIAVSGNSGVSGAISLALARPVAPNDNFANRITIAAPGTVTGTNLNATAETGEPLHFGRQNARNSVWWRYTPSVSGAVSIDTVGTGFDAVLAVYTGSAVNALTGVAADDDSAGNRQSRVRFRVTAGVSYAIAVSGFSANNFGAITLNLTALSPPANDLFASRITIAAPGSVTGTNVDAVGEPGEPGDHGGTNSNSVWWRFTPAATGPLAIDTIGSGFNTVLGVYTGSAVNALTAVASNDDIETGNLQSRVIFEATAGTSYAIAIAGQGGAQGAIRLTVTALSRPANDNFANRIAIAAPGTVTGNNTVATAEAGEPFHSGSTGARNSVWWRYTPSASGVIRIDTNGSGFSDTVLAVYTGTAVNALTEVASDDDSGDGNLSRLVVRVTAGVSYAIAVAGYDSSRQFGPVRLTITNVIPPANDLFANRTVIAGPGSVNGTTVDATAEAGEPLHNGDAFSRNSVWWRYTPSANATLRIDTTGSASTPVLAVYTGATLDALTLAAIDSSTSGSGLTLRVRAGVSYAIALVGRNNAEHAVKLNLANLASPPNDDFANRIAIAGPGSVTGTTVNATPEPGEPDHYPGNSTLASVWWRYTPTANATIGIDTIGSAGGSGPVIAVYTGSSVDALTQVTRNLGGLGSPDRKSRVTLRVMAGVSYAIAVTPFGPQDAVRLNLALVTPPANDNFANRTAIAGLGSVTGTTVNATRELGEPAHLPTDYAQNSVWWRYTPGADATISIDTIGSQAIPGVEGTVLAVYTGGSVDALALVTRADGNADQFNSRVTLRARAGVSYAIAVAGYHGSAGQVRLTLAAIAPPSNDNFASRIAIAGLGTVTGTTVNATTEAGEPGHHATFNTPNSVWWRYTPSADMALSIDTFDSSSSTPLAVYTGNAVNALALVARNENLVSVRLRAGVAYAIAVSGREGRQGAVSVKLEAVTPPANDQFANRITIASPGSVTGTTVNATLEAGEPVHIPGTSTSNTVWWRFTPPANTTLSFDTNGSDVDTALAVYTGGAVNALTQVAANNDIGGGNVLSRVTFNATAGVSYAIAVSGVEGLRGGVQLNLAVVAPTNDNFANRIAIAAPGTVSGNNVLATAETGEPNHAGNVTARTSVWWRFTPATTGPLTVQTFGSNFNTVLGVYTGAAVNGLTQVASNDDGGGGPLQSRLSFNAVAGTSYAIVIAGVGNATGDIALTVGPSPANDSFANRATIAALGTVTGNNSLATPEPGEPNHAGNATARTSIWWRFTPTVTGPLQVQTVGSSINTVLGVYTGNAVNGLTQIASNDDIGGGVLQSRVTFQATAGTSYAIAVAGVANATGAITLAVNGVAHNFARARLIESGAAFFLTNVHATAEPGEPIHAGVASARTSIWYRLTPERSGRVTLVTAGSISFNAVVAVYSGESLTALTPVASTSIAAGSSLVMNVNLVGGTTYRVAVAGVNNATGSILLSFNQNIPFNDAFANAANLADVAGGSFFTNGDLGTSTLNALPEAGEPIHAGNATARNSVWYHFTPTTTGNLTFDLGPSDFDTVLAVYTGSAVNALTLVASNDNIGGGNLRSRVTFLAQAGVRYSFAVAGNNNGFSTNNNIIATFQPAPPPNDNFANRVTIAALGSVTGINGYATAETGEPNHSGNATARTSVWWRFTPTVTGPLTVQTVGSSFNTVLGVYTGSAVNGLTQVASNDDIGGGNLQSRVALNAVAGTSYAIAVAGVSNASGNITLAVNSIAPANDNFANRVTIAALGSVTGNNAYATAETGEPNHAGNVTARTSVWWRFTPTVTGPLQVQTVGSSFNTVLGIYTGSAVNGLTQVASNNDIGGGNLQSRVTFQATAGVSYAIAVAGVSNATGNITLAVNNVLPINDAFANRITIAAPGTVAGSNAYSTAETNEPFHAGVAAARSSVWWRYTPAVSGPVLVDTMGSDFATVLAVYTGSAVNALTPVASNNDAHGGTNRSKVSFNGVAGTSYAIAVSGETTALTGNISLRIGGGVATPLPIIVSAVTPVARAALVNSTVTAFATVINAGPGVATSCFIAKPTGAPSVSFSYRTITGGQLGTPNTPVNIPAGAAQAFVMALSSSAALQSNLSLVFDCTNTRPASSTAGLNTFLLTATNAPAPADLVSAAVTPSGDGILNVPVNGTGFASLAAQNIGTAATLQARLSASAIGAPPATLPLTMVMCRTNPSTGACLEPPTGTTVNFNLGANQVATFAAFLTYTGTQIPFDPANKRVFVHFFQGTVPVGSASVAVRTTAPDAAGATAIGGKQARAE